jgi:hypothetical protein
MRTLILFIIAFLFIILTVSLVYYFRRDSKGNSMKTEQRYSLIAYRWANPLPGYKVTVEPNGTTIMEAWMNVKIENRGNDDAFNVQAALAKVPDDVNIIDSSVKFGNVKAHSAKWSQDSFKIRVVSKTPKPESTVWWNIEWNDVTGSHHTMQNVPMFGL